MKKLPVIATGFLLAAIIFIGHHKSMAQSSASAPADAASSLEQQVIAEEREGLDALKAGDVAHFGSLTADEAVFVDAHGPAGKTQVVQNVDGFILADYSIADVHFVPIDATTGLISYKISEKGVSHGKEFAAQAYVSSIWTRRGNQWLCLFSQETGVH